MRSNEAKTKILHYFRFRRRFKFIATEVGPFNSDVLVSNSREILEVEIKVALSDLRAEFKKRKHYHYSNGDRYIPNKFYMAVPEYLIEPCKELIGTGPYGIIGIDNRVLNNRRREVFCKIDKQARPLSLNFSKPLHEAIVLRMGSELIQNRIKGDGRSIQEMLLSIRDKVVKLKKIRNKT